MMQFLLYNMGRLPGGLTDHALAYQQKPSFTSHSCSPTGTPTTSYGWFRAKRQSSRGETVVMNKNGGVAGYTSWMGFTQWQGSGAPSPHGLFVLSNGPDSTKLGNAMMKLLLEG